MSLNGLTRKLHEFGLDLDSVDETAPVSKSVSHCATKVAGAGTDAEERQRSVRVQVEGIHGLCIQGRRRVVERHPGDSKRAVSVELLRQIQPDICQAIHSGWQSVCGRDSSRRASGRATYFLLARECVQPKERMLVGPPTCTTTYDGVTY